MRGFLVSNISPFPEYLPNICQKFLASRRSLTDVNGLLEVWTAKSRSDNDYFGDDNCDGAKDGD